MKTFKLIMLIALMGSALSSEAQFLKKLGKSVMEKTAEKTANKVADKASDKAVDKVFEEGKDKDKKEKESGGKDLEATDENAITSYSKFDFVPGDSILYAEDFAQDNIGELPVNWNSNAGGVVVAVESPKGKWMELDKGMYLSGSKLKSFGKDYTIEWDMILNVTPKMGYYLPPLFFGAFSTGLDDNSDNKYLRNNQYRLNNSFEFKIDPNPDDRTSLTLRSYDKNKDTFISDQKKVASFGKTLRKVAHYAISVQGSRLRLWIDEVKVLDVPKAVNTGTPIHQLFFSTDLTGGYNDENFSYLLSNIKVAAGKPDTRSKLITEGKFVTSGILFDVNSDQIKPQSYPVLKEIADVLKENPDVKIRITGHTDADGSAASNLALSKKRAASVKAFLNTSFSIEPGRMETDGLGLTKPIADNKTATGKAANRRVEFIKL